MKAKILALVLIATAFSAVVAYGGGLGDDGLFLNAMQVRTDSMTVSTTTSRSCGTPPGSPSVWVDGTDLDGSANATLVDGAEFDGTPTILNKGSLGGTFAGAATASPTFKSSCLGRGSPKSCLSFDGTNDTAVSSLAAASFRFIHEGPSTCYAIAQTVQNAATGTTLNAALYATARANTGETGLVTYLQDSQYNSNEYAVSLYDGVAPAAATFASASGVYVSQTWSRASLRYEPSITGNDLTTIVNGVDAGGAEPTAAAAVSPTRSLYLGAAFNALFMKGEIFQVVCYSSALSSGNIATLDTWGQCKTTTTPYAAGSCSSGAAKLCGAQSPCRIGVIGDSISFAAGGVTEWPDTLRTNLGAGYVVINEAVSGTTIATAKTAQWTNRLKTAGLTALIIFAGRNDIDGGATSTTALADVATVANDAIADGVKVLTISDLPAGLSSGWTAGEQVHHDAFNVGLAAAATGCRSFLDLYADAEDPDGSDDLRADWDSGDGLHPNQIGQDAIEAAVRPLVGP